MKEILLTQGQVALVDDEDYEVVNQYKWCASWNSHTRSYYALRRVSYINSNGEKKRKPVLMHRLIMSPVPELDVDHRDHNTLNNTKANLRVCTRSQNMGNVKKLALSTSDYKGVSIAKGRKNWRAHIRLDNKSMHLGVFPTPEEAARAYDIKAREVFGEYALTNFSER